MGEKHFPQFGVQRFFAGGQGEGHIPQAEPLQLLRPGLFCFQTDQDGRGRRDSVSQIRGKAESVSGGTGGGIAEPAAGQDDRVRGKDGAVLQFRSGDPALCCLQAVNSAVQADADIQFPQEAGEGLGDVTGLFGSREDPLSALHRDRTAVFFHEGHHILRRKKTQRTVKKPRIAGHLGEKTVQIAVVGQVAAAFAGDIDFLSELFIFFQQGDFSPCAGGKNSGHHAGCAATDDQYFTHNVSASGSIRQKRRESFPLFM